MAAVVFDNTIIFKHPFYPKCKATLQDISDRDYSSGSYQFDPRIECLDMDVYERVICQGNPDKTVDAVIGICTCGSDKRKSNPRLMLIELRMDYTTSPTRDTPAHWNAEIIRCPAVMAPTSESKAATPEVLDRPVVTINAPIFMVSPLS